MDDPYRTAFVQACLANAPADARSLLTRLDRVVDEVVAPAAAGVDRDAGHPAAALEALATIGVPAVLVPREYGGLGFDSGVAAVVVERVARACASTAAILMFHYQVVNRTLSFAHAARRDDDLVAFAGGALAASAWTEPTTAKDKTGLRTRLTTGGTDLAVDGIKTFCTGLRSASVVDVLLTANLDGAEGPTFVRIDLKSAGVRVEEPYPMLGLRGTGTTTLRLDAVPVDRSDVLAEVGSGRALMRANHRTPLNPGLLALGIAGAAFDAARRLCAGLLPGVPARRDSPVAQAALADAAMRLESAYASAAALVRRIADRPQTSYECASRLKAHATATAETVTRNLLPAAGSRGFLASFPFERHLRDAQATVLMGPTNDLCAERVAAALLEADPQRPEGAP